MSSCCAPCTPGSDKIMTMDIDGATYLAVGAGALVRVSLVARHLDQMDAVIGWNDVSLVW